MADEDIPWEASLLKDFVGNTKSLKPIGYVVGSVLASTWYIASTSSSSPSLCGSSLEDQLEIRQWIEFYLTRIKSASPWQPLPRDQIFNVLKELNIHFSSSPRLYFCWCGFSLADVLIYYGLHSYLADMSFNDKSNFIHVCRWFDQVQHYPNLKPFLWSWVACPRLND